MGELDLDFIQINGGLALQYGINIKSVLLIKETWTAWIVAEGIDRCTIMIMVC